MSTLGNIGGPSNPHSSKPNRTFGPSEPLALIKNAFERESRSPYVKKYFAQVVKVVPDHTATSGNFNTSNDVSIFSNFRQKDTYSYTDVIKKTEAGLVIRNGAIDRLSSNTIPDSEKNSLNKAISEAVNSHFAGFQTQPERDQSLVANRRLVLPDEGIVTITDCDKDRGLYSIKDSSNVSFTLKELKSQEITFIQSKGQDRLSPYIHIPDPNMHLKEFSQPSHNLDGGYDIMTPIPLEKVETLFDCIRNKKSLSQNQFATIVHQLPRCLSAIDSFSGTLDSLDSRSVVIAFNDEQPTVKLTGVSAKVTIPNDDSSKNLENIIRELASLCSTLEQTQLDALITNITPQTNSDGTNRLLSLKGIEAILTPEKPSK